VIKSKKKKKKKKSSISCLNKISIQVVSMDNMARYTRFTFLTQKDKKQR